jgi:hypothetical protein
MGRTSVTVDVIQSELNPPLVHDPETEVVAPSGVAYRVLVAGRYEDAGIWGGWVEFYPSDPELDPLRTDRETTQTNYSALVRWAHGLGRVDLEAAFVRAHPWPPEGALSSA